MDFNLNKIMNIIPVNNRLLVKNIKQELKKISGILIPDIISEKPGQGLVIAKSFKNKFLKSEIKVGQHILFNKYAGQKIKYENNDFLLLKEDDVLAIVEL